VIDAAATWDEAAASGAVFLVNRDPEAATTVTVDLGRLGDGVRAGDSVLLHDEDRHARNTLAEPERVRLRPLDVTTSAGVATLTLPPVSWAAVPVAVVG